MYGAEIAHERTPPQVSECWRAGAGVARLGCQTCGSAAASARPPSAHLPTVQCSAMHGSNALLAIHLVVDARHRTPSAACTTARSNATGSPDGHILHGSAMVSNCRPAALSMMSGVRYTRPGLSANHSPRVVPGSEAMVNGFLDGERCAARCIALMRELLPAFCAPTCHKCPAHTMLDSTH